MRREYFNYFGESSKYMQQKQSSIVLAVEIEFILIGVIEPQQQHPDFSNHVVWLK